MNIWITRDEKDGDEPDLLFIHGSKPRLQSDGQWTNETGECIAVPTHLKHGKSKRLQVKVLL